MTGQEMRVHVKRNSKKKSGYEVEKRDDGFYYGKQRNGYDIWPVISLELFNIIV